MKSKLTTALILLLALVFVVSSFVGCANGGEGTESGSASPPACTPGISSISAAWETTATLASSGPRPHPGNPAARCSG